MQSAAINTSAFQSVKIMKDQTFQVNGPKLFNRLLANILNLSKCLIEDFKMAKDKYLERVPDKPNVRGVRPGGCTADARASNSSWTSQGGLD